MFELTNSPLLEVKNITKTYGQNTALNNVSFHLNQNEILGLVGANGAGKTTMIKLIAGLIHPDRGSILVNGKIPKESIIEGELSFILDHPALYEDLTANENLSFFSSLYPAFNKDLLRELIERFQISFLLKKKVKSLSNGEKQKVAIVRSLSSDAKLYVLDEPFNALDYQSRQVFLDIIGYLKKEFNKGFLITSHNYSLLEKVCDKVVFLNKGSVEYFNSMEELNNKMLFKIHVKSGIDILLKHLKNTTDIEVVKKGSDFIVISAGFDFVLEILDKFKNNDAIHITSVSPVGGGIEAYYLSKSVQ